MIWKEAEVPGVRPGWDFRFSWQGDVFILSQDLYLALAVFPAIVVSLMDVQQSWAMFFGGTSLIIGWCHNRYNSTN
jgi:preprotein translocase subunit SecY